MLFLVWKLSEYRNFIGRAHLWFLSTANMHECARHLTIFTTPNRMNWTANRLSVSSTPNRTILNRQPAVAIATLQGTYASRGASTKRPLLRTLLPYITVLVCVLPCIIYSWTKYSFWGNGFGFYVFIISLNTMSLFFSSLMYRLL